MKRSLVLSFLLYFFTLAVSGQEMQSGLYASTTVLELANGEKKSKQIEDCITPKDIADGLTNISIQSDPACKVQNYSKSGGKISYRLACKDGRKKLDSDVAGSFTKDSYNFAIKPSASGTSFKSITVKGWRTGPCEPGK